MYDHDFSIELCNIGSGGLEEEKKKKKEKEMEKKLPAVVSVTASATRTWDVYR